MSGKIGSGIIGNKGIEGVIYQNKEYSSDKQFPARKRFQVSGVYIPKHLERVFNLLASRQAVEVAIKPEFEDGSVMTPMQFRDSLTDLINVCRSGSECLTEPQKMVFGRAEKLLTRIQENHGVYERGRNALVQA